MSYELNFDRRPNYIHAIVTGQNTAEAVVQYMTDIQSECEKQDCYRVLIEENLEGPRLGEMEIFNLISKGSSTALGFFELLAYVDENQQFEISKFAETVAVNRGIPVAVFSSVADARNWLKHRPEDADDQKFFIDGDGSDRD